MAREARKISKSGNYYVVLKGDKVFVTDDDKKMFREILEKNFATGVVHAVYITKTEIRLVVKEGEKGISMTMKPVITSYARYFNRTHNREGKLFIGRFKSEPLETTQEIEEAIKNIKQNAAKKAAPQKAKGSKMKIEKQETTAPKPKPQPQPKRNLPSWLL